MIFVCRYLRVTHSKLEIDFFNFDFFVNVFKQWKPDRTFVEVEDMSHGRENVPVSCVNSLDNNYSEYIEYRSGNFCCNTPAFQILRLNLFDLQHQETASERRVHQFGRRVLDVLRLRRRLPGQRKVRLLAGKGI